MLTFEELSVMLSLEQDLGVSKPDLVYAATNAYKSPKFDQRVALATIDRLVGIDLISRDRAGYLYITGSGREAVAQTKAGSMRLINKLVYGK